MVIVSRPLQSPDASGDPRFSVPIATPSSDAFETHPVTAAAATQPLAAEKARPAWTRTADAAVSLGRVSQGAGIATAAIFNRFGKKIARSF
jgi:hypothetical protein